MVVRLKPCKGERCLIWQVVCRTNMYMKLDDGVADEKLCQRACSVGY